MLYNILYVANNNNNKLIIIIIIIIMIIIIIQPHWTLHTYSESANIEIQWNQSRN